MTHFEKRLLVAKHEAWDQARALYTDIAYKMAYEDYECEKITDDEVTARAESYKEALHETLGEQPPHPASRAKAAQKLNMLRRK